MYAPRSAAGPEHNAAVAHWPYPPPPPSTSQPPPPTAPPSAAPNHPQQQQQQQQQQPPPPLGPPYYAAPGQVAPPPQTSLPPLNDPRAANMDVHRPPPPPQAYGYPAPHDARAHPHAHYPYPPAGHAPYPPQPHQPAPRQRTAIACRYCRRRKIRCSGFDSAEDGRCSNCTRFSQECVFTPVSAQAQAFVPAHAAYRAGQPPPQLFGAYGQPLPPSAATHDPYGRPHPLPAHHYPPYGAPPPSGYASPAYDDRSSVNGARKRPADEPHTPTLPPPQPGMTASMPRSMAEPDYGYRYPDPTAAAPAAASPYAAGPPPQAQALVQPYYTTQPVHRGRVSPPLASPYSSTNDGQRSSLSPNTGTLPAPSTPGPDGHAPYSAADYRTAQQAAAAATKNADYRSAPVPASSNGGSDYRTPTSAPDSQHQQKLQTNTANRSPPQISTPVSATSSGSAAQNGKDSRLGMSISSIVSGDGLSPGGRSNTDSAMLSRFGK